MAINAFYFHLKDKVTFFYQELEGLEAINDFIESVTSVYLK